MGEFYKPAPSDRPDSRQTNSLPGVSLLGMLLPLISSSHFVVPLLLRPLTPCNF